MAFDRPPRPFRGAFSVDGPCSGCGLCVAYAPATFAWSADGSRCHVARQPRTGREYTAAQAAAADCPMACIEAPEPGRCEGVAS
jgi:ferredoxin